MHVLSLVVCCIVLDAASGGHWEELIRIEPEEKNPFCVESIQCRKWCFRLLVPEKHDRFAYCKNNRCGCTIYRYKKDPEEPKREDIPLKPGPVAAQQN